MKKQDEGEFLFFLNCVYDILELKDLQKEFNVSTLNIEKVRELINFHKLNCTINLDSYLSENHRYSKFNTNGDLNYALIDLNNKSKRLELEKIFTTNKIKHKFFKGSEIVKKYYEPQNLKREIGDIDVLVSPEDFGSTVSSLLKNNFIILTKSRKTVSNDDFYNLHLGNNIELTLAKVNSSNWPQVDVHKKLYPSFIPISIYDSFFFQDDVDNYLKDGIIILIHHGNRESWLTFRHIFDYYLFYINKPENFDWNDHINLLKEFKLYRSFCTGNMLLNKFFNLNIPFVDKASNTENIFNFWINPFDLHNPKITITQKLFIRKCEFLIQDNRNLIRYIKSYVDFHSEDNTVVKNNLKKRKTYYRFFRKILKIVVKN